MPGLVMHSDHYNTVHKLAAMLLREVGIRIMQQFNAPVDWEVVPYKFPLPKRSRFWIEIAFYEDADEKLKNAKLSHPGLALALLGGGGGDNLVSALQLVADLFLALLRHCWPSPVSNSAHLCWPSPAP